MKKLFLIFSAFLLSLMFFCIDSASAGALLFGEIDGDNHLTLINPPWNICEENHIIVIGAYYIDDENNEEYAGSNNIACVNGEYTTAYYENLPNYYIGVGTYQFRYYLPDTIPPVYDYYINTDYHFGVWTTTAPVGCILITDQNICNVSGCYWCDGNCFYDPQPGECDLPSAGVIVFPSFIDYFSENTDPSYPDPGDLIISLSGFIQTIVNSVAGFFSNFQNTFDIDQATARGTELGLVIPRARGYLIPINSFFGGFPLSELFIFCLLILIAVILFRGITRIWTAIRG